MTSFERSRLLIFRVFFCSERSFLFCGSNPMAGMDTTLLALSGIGLKYNKVNAESLFYTMFAVSWFY